MGVIRLQFAEESNYRLFFFSVFGENHWCKEDKYGNVDSYMYYICPDELLKSRRLRKIIFETNEILYHDGFYTASAKTWYNTLTKIKLI